MLKANLSTSETMFPELRAMAEPAPASVIQTEFPIDLGSYCDFIEPRVIHRKHLTRILKKGL